MNRIKIAIETSTSCIGKCVGCALTHAQKSSIYPAIIEENLLNFFSKLEHFYNQVHTSTKKEKILVIELVIGEHFNFSDDYFHSLFLNLKNFLLSTEQQFIVAISTSGLLPPNKMEPKLKIIHQYLNKESLEVHLVCDLNLFSKYNEKYEESILLFKQYFSFLNILTNFDNKISLENCLLLSKFLSRHDITDLQLVYGLKNHNLKMVGESKNIFFDIYKEILKTNTTTHRHIDILEILNNQFTTDLEIKEHIELAVDNILLNQYFISHEGNVHYFLPTPIGTIELDSRAGFFPITNIYQEDSTKIYLDSKKNLIKDLIKIYSQNTLCHNCDFQKNCYSYGIPLLHKLFYNNNKCNNPLLSFFEHQNDLNFSITNTLNDWKALN